MKPLLISLVALPCSLNRARYQLSKALAAPVRRCPLRSLQCADVSAALIAVTNQDTRLRDWANLARYREANKTVTRADAVFMGDSITDLWQQPRFGGFFPGKNYVDRGISAQTTPQMLLRFRPDVIALKPRVVVILAGTNDIAGNTGPMTNEEIQNNLASMAELAKANNIRVVLSSITPVSAYHAAPNAPPQTTRRPVERIQAINAWMKVVRRGQQTRVSRLLLRDDRQHRHVESGIQRGRPASERGGYKVMAPLAEAAIAQALR